MTTLSTLGAELLKIRRSLGLAVVVVLPLAMALGAIANTLASGEPLTDGWQTLWLRCVVFFGLFPMAIGIAILASLVWRPEHRGGNWNALMASPTAAIRVVVGKASVVSLLAAGMQLVLLAAYAGLGKWAFGLPGWPPATHVGVTALVMVACVPLAVTQSALSMVMRSFAAPIGVALVLAGVSVVALLAMGDAAIVSPYALAARATQLGTGTFGDSGTITGGLVATLVGVAVALSIALVALASAVLDRREAKQ